MNNEYASALERLTDERARINAAIRVVRKNRKFITALNKRVSLCYNKLDFDNLTRPDVLKVLKAFPGKWLKNNHCGGDRINYEQEVEDGRLAIRIYAGEAPECCKVEEVVEYVTVPEHVDRRVTRRLVCPEPKTPKETL